MNVYSIKYKYTLFQSYHQLHACSLSLLEFEYNSLLSNQVRFEATINQLRDDCTQQYLKASSPVANSQI